LLGRFISEDPLEFDSGDVNFYAYAGDDPIDLDDPSGMVAAGTGTHGKSPGPTPSQSAALSTAGRKILKSLESNICNAGTLFMATSICPSDPIANAVHRWMTPKCATPEGDTFTYKGVTFYNVHCDAQPAYPIGLGGAGAAAADDSLAYEQYWQNLGRRAPQQSSPYNIINKYDPATGELKSVTTYDEYGNRAYQYEINPNVRHGPGYHEYSNSCTIGQGNGPRGGHTPF